MALFLVMYLVLLSLAVGAVFALHKEFKYRKDLKENRRRMAASRMQNTIRKLRVGRPKSGYKWMW